jgi:Zn-dependent membrane protease YugP
VDWGLYIWFFIVPFAIGMAVQWWLKKTVQTHARIAVRNGLTGAQVARTILDANGLQGVPVQQAPGGALSDHYDPRRRTVNLSEVVYGHDSVAATAIGAHEVGHAIQHQQAYVFFRFRSAMWPIVAIASQAWIFVLLAGALLGALGLVQVALVLFAVVVLFQLVTLPVEFDASRRAAQQLQALDLVTVDEAGGVRKVLTAAAMTYVAGALAAISQLVYFLLIFFGNRS